MSQVNGSNPTPSPTLDQHLAAGDEVQGRISSPMAPSFVKGFDHEDDHNQPVKKSVLARVKEKAKKWRNTLLKRKPVPDGSNTTPAWGVSLEEDEEDDAEYHGAPMYESELASDENKDATTRNPAPPSATPTEKHVLTAQTIQGENNNVAVKNDTNNKTLTETVTDKLAPVYNMVSEATQMIASKIQGPSASVGPAAAATAAKEEPSERPRLQKSVSVKEYLMKKLEPGAEERALSRVISDVITSSKVGDNGEVGVVEKMKGAVTSLLAVEEPTPSSSSASSVTPAASNNIAPARVAEETLEKRLQAN